MNAACALVQKGKVAILIEGKPKAVDSAAHFPPSPFRVAEVDLLDQPDLRDDDLARFKGLTAVQKLLLKGRSITDAGLEHLGGLTALQQLRLDATSVTGTGFRHLGNLHQLRILKAYYGNSISDEGLAAIPALPNLTHFACNTGNISDEWLRHLSRLRGLQTRQLSWGTLSGEGFRHLTELPNLREHHAGHGQLTDANLVGIQHNPAPGHATRGPTVLTLRRLVPLAS